MPYIAVEQRDKLKYAIEFLAAHLDSVDDEEIEGVMNYTISTLLSKRMKPESGWRYKWINRTLGVLEAVKLEFVRRVVGTYEDDCINRNGDIEAYVDI